MLSRNKPPGPDHHSQGRTFLYHAYHPILNETELSSQFECTYHFGLRLHDRQLRFPAAPGNWCEDTSGCFSLVCNQSQRYRNGFTPDWCDVEILIFQCRNRLPTHCLSAVHPGSSNQVCFCSCLIITSGTVFIMLP